MDDIKLLKLNTARDEHFNLINEYHYRIDDRKIKIILGRPGYALVEREENGKWKELMRVSYFDLMFQRPTQTENTERFQEGDQEIILDYVKKVI